MTIQSMASNSSLTYYHASAATRLLITVTFSTPTPVYNNNLLKQRSRSTRRSPASILWQNLTKAWCVDCYHHPLRGNACALRLWLATARVFRADNEHEHLKDQLPSQYLPACNKSTMHYLEPSRSQQVREKVNEIFA
jgi:hypothetical protein